MSQVDLSIVIVNYNGIKYTAPCLDSIRQTNQTLRYEIILIDNASTDGSVDWLEEHHPEIRLIKSSQNLGVAWGNNQGIRAARARYVLLLNNDTLVLPGALERVTSYLDQHPAVAGVGGNLLNEDHSFQSGYTDFPSLGQEFLITTKLGMLARSCYPSHPPGEQVCEADWMSTACMAFRRDVLEQIGLVDEEYFMYSDETDLQYRLHQAGWKIVYLPDLQTIHFGGKSIDPWRRRHLVYRGKLLFFQKHYGRWRTLALRALYVAVGAAKLPVWAFLGLFPRCRQRARRELDSNRKVVHLGLAKSVPQIR